jgi:hypothetical protein
MKINFKDKRPDVNIACCVPHRWCNGHVAPLGHIIPILSQPVFALFLNAVRLAKKQQILIF